MYILCFYFEGTRGISDFLWLTMENLTEIKPPMRPENGLDTVPVPGQSNVSAVDVWTLPLKAEDCVRYHRWYAST